MTIQEVRKFLSANPDTETKILELIELSISKKKTAFAETEVQNIVGNGELDRFIIRFPVDLIKLDYDSLEVVEVLLRKSESLLSARLPQDPMAALEFTDRFCEEIRKPKIRTIWYGNLESGLESYVLIFINQIYNVDVSLFLRNLTTDQKDEVKVLRNYDSNYTGAFPFLNDTIEQSFETLIFLYSSEDQVHTAKSCLEKMGKRNTEKALLLYEYSKNHGAIKYDRFLSTLLVELYALNKVKFFKEAIELHNTDPVQGLVTIAWFRYDESSEIEDAFTFITQAAISEVNYQKVLVDFYCRLIENLSTPKTIRSQCFARLKDLVKIDDDHVRGHTIWRVSVIDGYDEEKFALLPDFLATGQKNVLNKIFDRFRSPKYLFELIRDSYIVHGMKVQYAAFNHAVSMQFHQNATECEAELLKMLSDDLAIVRYAGLQVLTGNHGQTYSINLLGLEEEGQKRVIETVLLQPVGIEELLPIVLQLRKSPFVPVRDLLTEQLVSLIWAYDHDLVDLIRPVLDVSDNIDKDLLEKIEEGYKAFLTEKEIRNSISEFDPAQNELHSLELYFRLEQEKNAEMMERVSGKSIFTQMAKTISVIRGNAFKTEENPAITKMQIFSTSRLVDQRYYQDPEYYEWIFQRNVYGKNYSKTE